MEDKTSKKEDDAIEMLTGLIPCATSRNACADSCIPIRLAKEGRKSSPSLDFQKLYHVTQAERPESNFVIPFGRPSNAFVHSSEGQADEKIQTQRILVRGNSDAKSGYQKPVETTDLESLDMPLEQSFASAFVGLSSEDQLSIEATNIQKANALNDINLLNLPSNGFDQFSVEMNYQENMDFSEFDYPIMEHKAYPRQALALRMNTSEILPSLPAPGIEVPAVPCLQHYFPSVQYSLPQMHLQGLSQSCSPWFHIEEENLTRENRNGADLIRSWNIKQSCIDPPVFYKYEHWIQESFQTCHAIHRGFTSLASTFTSNYPCRYCMRGGSSPFAHGNTFYPTHARLALSAQGLDEVQDFTKMGKQKFPEKILTRKNGSSLLKTIKFSSVEEHKPPEHARANARVLPDSHLHFNAQIQSAEPFQLDGRKLWGQSSYTPGGRHDDIRLLSQIYDLTGEMNCTIYYMAKDQHGCRILQRKLTEGTAEDVEKIFLEVLDQISELMTHPFGNYLVQKLLQVCNEHQMTQIIYAITTICGDLVKISCNKHGTRVAQEIIKSIKTSEQASRIVSSVKPGVVNLMKDSNGYHVAKYCLEYLTPRHNEFLFEAATAHCVELATNCHGCCVLKDCLNRSVGEQRLKLISEITPNAVILSQDPFGNYVVQHVLELELPWATAEVLKQLEGNYGYLSKQKFGSNVVEKCLGYAGKEHFPRIIQEFIDHSELNGIMQDCYGNFVIQSALNHSKGALHAALMEAIRPHIPALRASPYGKKVLSCHGFKKQPVVSSPSSLVKTRFSPIS